MSRVMSVLFAAVLLCLPSVSLAQGNAFGGGGGGGATTSVDGTTKVTNAAEGFAIGCSATAGTQCDETNSDVYINPAGSMYITTPGQGISVTPPDATGAAITISEAGNHGGSSNYTLKMGDVDFAASAQCTINPDWTTTGDCPSNVNRVVGTKSEFPVIDGPSITEDILGYTWGLTTHLCDGLACDNNPPHKYGNLVQSVSTSTVGTTVPWVVGPVAKAGTIRLPDGASFPADVPGSTATEGFSDNSSIATNRLTFTNSSGGSPAYKAFQTLYDTALWTNTDTFREIESITTHVTLPCPSPTCSPARGAQQTNVVTFVNANDSADFNTTSATMSKAKAPAVLFPNTVPITELRDAVFMIFECDPDLSASRSNPQSGEPCYDPNNKKATIYVSWAGLDIFAAPLGDTSIYTSGTTWSTPDPHRVDLLHSAANVGAEQGYKPLTTSGALAALPAAAATSTYIRSFKANNDACLYDAASASNCVDAIQVVNNTAAPVFYQFTTTMVQTQQTPYSACAVATVFRDDATILSGPLSAYFITTADNDLTPAASVGPITTIAAGATLDAGLYATAWSNGSWTPRTGAAPPGRCSWSSVSGQGTFSLEVKQCTSSSACP